MQQETGYLELLHYRRCVSDLYATARQSSLPLAERWTWWRQGRDQLFAHHPQSALTPAQKKSFSGLAYYPYDPAWRFEATVDTAVEPTIFPIETAHDGVVRAQRVGKLILDFNYAYNPSCAYNPQWSCPLAPPENWLPVAVPVGEQEF